MDSNALHSHFPLTKGTILFIGMLMVFLAIVLGIYLWYELRLEEIENSMNLLSKQTF
jgi:hypothetical protein